jgi:hypothetical protein
MKGKSNENNVLSHLIKFIFLPEKLISSIRQFIFPHKKQQHENATTNERKIENYALSVDDFFHKKGVLQVRLQIKGTRAVFKIPLQELAVDFNLLSQIDPLELIQIGYHAKEEEIKRNQKLILNAKKDRNNNG